jgi:hypothetical protein
MKICAKCRRIMLSREKGNLCILCSKGNAETESLDSKDSKETNVTFDINGTIGTNGVKVPSPSRYAAYTIRRLDPRIHKIGFNKSLRSMMKTLVDEKDDDCLEGIKKFNYVPDLYMMDYVNKRVVVWEIEDNNMLTMEKMLAYSELEWVVDVAGIELCVIVTDRYGLLWRIIDLPEFYEVEAIEKNEDPKFRGIPIDWSAVIENLKVRQAEQQIGYPPPDKKDRERSEERRVGKECTSKCRSRWSPYH